MPYNNVIPAHLVPGILARLQAEAEAACTCYPDGFTPATFEGPMRDCPKHGEKADGEESE